MSGRFHHSIAAAYLGTPFVLCASNTPKNNALLEELGLSKPLSYDEPELGAAMIDRSERVIDTTMVDDERLAALAARSELNFTGLPEA